jgi:hypothetical protein
LPGDNPPYLQHKKPRSTDRSGDTARIIRLSHRNIEKPGLPFHSDEHCGGSCTLALSIIENPGVGACHRRNETGSSKWIKTKGSQYANFYWQEGYAAFSVGQVGLEKVIEYIENQQKHHERVSFQEEVRQFFKWYGLELDERTFWD